MPCRRCVATSEQQSRVRNSGHHALFLCPAALGLRVLCAFKSPPAPLPGACLLCPGSPIALQGPVTVARAVLGYAYVQGDHRQAAGSFTNEILFISTEDHQPPAVKGHVY